MTKHWVYHMSGHRAAIITSALLRLTLFESVAASQFHLTLLPVKISMHVLQLCLSYCFIMEKVQDKVTC